MEPDDAPLSDEMLRLFTTNASGELNVTMGLTLFVHGSVVSGVLIGAERWLELWEQTVAAPDNEQVATFTHGVRKELTASVADDGTPVADGYIHLCDAVYVSAGKVLPAGVRGLWRGRLSEVSGWGPGNLTLDQ